MHDLDRAQSYFETEDEFDSEAGFDFEFDPQWEGESVFDEQEELELAAELLSVGDDAELEMFLGKLIKRAGRTVGRFVKGPVGKALGRTLKGLAKKALPIVGGALGNVIAPGIGGAIGSRLASGAGSLFGLELEGLSPEDQELEVAKRVVRLAGDAAKNAAMTSGVGSPQAIANSAVAAAARSHAPGIAAGGPRPVSGTRGRSGRWIRRGRNIVLLGA